jgi:hypothetical protein
MRIVSAFLILVLAGASALAQQMVPPPPRPAPDAPPPAPAPVAPAPAAPAPAANGPSLDVTLKFIQDKVNEQGKIVFAESAMDSLTGAKADENASATQGRVMVKKPAAPSPAFGVAKKGSFASVKGSPEQFARTDVVTVDPSGMLSIRETGTNTGAQRSAWAIAQGTGDWTKAWSVYFKNAEKLEVLNSTDYKHRMNPVMTYQDDPPYFELVVHMAAGKPVIRHIQTVSGNKHATITESNESVQEFALHFRDEDTANRVAKAMIHVIELCAGGSAPEPF